jgi:hypothetical protein
LSAALPEAGLDEGMGFDIDAVKCEFGELSQ